MICPVRFCGGTLTQSCDGLGRMSDSCRRCERRAAGLCKDCPAVLASDRHWYCRLCAKRRRQKRGNSKWRSDYHRTYMRNAYQHRRLDPEWCARRRAINEAYYRRKKVRTILGLPHVDLRRKEVRDRLTPDSPSKACSSW